MKTKKILMLLSNAFNPDPRVHREAIALIEKGYDVEILCWDRDLKKPLFEIIEGIKIERIYIPSTHGRGSSQILFLFLFWIKALFKTLYKKKIDIVHAHDFDTLPLGFIISRIKKARLVYDAHESYIDMLLNIPSLLKKMIFKAENFFMKRTDLVITVGDILKEYLVKRGAPKACVVGNWQDPEKFVFTLEEKYRILDRFVIQKNQLVIVFIAHLGIERQLPQLIDAVKQSPGVYLILGGYGPCENLAADAAANYSNITYLGYVNPSEIPLYTAVSDIVFYGFDPNVPNAAFSAPNKLFEGLAAGKVILTCDFGEIGKIVKQNNCGIILKDYSIDEIKTALDFLQDNNFTKFSENAKSAGLNLYNWGMAKHELIEQYEYLTPA
ncbi:MAG: glycosyltransferase family 4 protein [Desulfobacula sp.]|nr:glycosyltransferase family 4 protein [Desulfobacula sp.]